VRAAAFALLLAGCPCGGNPGVLVNARPDVTFVTEKAALIVAAPDGIRRVAIDGTSSTKLFGTFAHRDVPAVTVVDVTPDFKTYLLSDSNTNLYVGDATTGATWEVTQLRKRLSAAAFSPDGRKIAATRHADFDTRQSSWRDDDTVFVIDVATRQVEELPRATANWPTKIQWSADGSALWLTFAWEKGHQWLTLADRTRTDVAGAKPPAPLRADPRSPPVCPQQLVESKQPQLSISDDPNKPARVLVRLEGRERGFHDYLADFSHAAMTPACKYVVFEHRNKVWISDLQGAAIGPIVSGAWLFFAP
jgi:dipeptidyl aminopeptidase/acylaminoacyl peptidase